jgi:hypothetical protein
MTTRCRIKGCREACYRLTKTCKRHRKQVQESALKFLASARRDDDPPKTRKCPKCREVGHSRMQCPLRLPPV